MPEFKNTFMFATVFLIILKYSFMLFFSVSIIELIYVHIIALFIGMIDFTRTLIAESRELVSKR